MDTIDHKQNKLIVDGDNRQKIRSIKKNYQESEPSNLNPLFDYHIKLNI